jgi:hypothetical protein
MRGDAATSRNATDDARSRHAWHPVQEGGAIGLPSRPAPTAYRAQ